MRTPKTKPPKGQASDTLRRLQNIARKKDQQADTTDDIESSAAQLRRGLDRLYADTVELATRHHVQPADIAIAVLRLCQGREP